MSGAEFDGDRKPGTLPARTTAEVVQHAQEIYDKRAEPPYSADACLNKAEAIVLSDFVAHWLPFLDRSKK